MYMKNSLEKLANEVKDHLQACRHENACELVRNYFIDTDRALLSKETVASLVKFFEIYLKRGNGFNDGYNAGCEDCANSAVDAYNDGYDEGYENGRNSIVD
jgi:hypothetical protein